MKKLFNKIMSISIMSLGCMLSFVSFVKADGPDWLKVGSREYVLFSELSKDSQEKLIDLYKKTIKEKKSNIKDRKPSFINKLKALDNLLENPSEEKDKQILPIVTGYLKKDNIVYINFSVFKVLTGHCRSGISGYFNGLDLKSAGSLDQMTHFDSIASLNDLFRSICNKCDYDRCWSILVPSDYTRRLPDIPYQMKSVPINKDEGTDFASIYVSPSRLLNNHTNTNTSLGQQLQVFLESFK